jgi:hypothetical protein
MINRRTFFLGLIAAPAIARAEMLMPVKLWRPSATRLSNGLLLCDGGWLRASDEPELFSLLGHLYGGSHDRFRLPDMRAAVESPPVGVTLIKYGITSAGMILPSLDSWGES